MNAINKTIDALSIRNFSGFYESIWLSSESCSQNYLDDYFETSGIEYNLDWKKYQAEISAAFFREYETEILNLFSPGLISLEYAGSWSPQYYNFSTDEILYNLEIKDLRLFNFELFKLIRNHRVALEVYLKEKFTTRDGFISFYSPRLEDWTAAIKNNEADSVQISVLLDFFILQETPEIEYNIYEDLNGNGYNIESYMQPEPESLKNKLDHLRGEIEAERVSYGEISELQNLARWIPEDDILLRQWANIPEFPEN